MSGYQSLPLDEYDDEDTFQDNPIKYKSDEPGESGSSLWREWKPLAIFGVVALVGSLATVTYVNEGLLTYPSIDVALESYSTITHHQQRALFVQFKERYGKEYKDDEEEEFRWSAFKDSLYLIDSSNADESKAGGAGLYGITQFSDYTSDERLSLIGSSFVDMSSKFPPAQDSQDYSRDSTTATSVDWTGIYTTSVNDQGDCASGWAFSAAQQIESDAIRQGLISSSVKLSSQQLLNCDSYDGGCESGWPTQAYYFINENGGLTSDSVVPYAAEESECSTNSDPVVTVSEYYQLADEDAMIDYVLTTGPISVCLHADESWFDYVDGVVTNCGTEVNACMQVVGVNVDEGYWLVRNSWGTEWGLSGFIKLKLSANTCGITYMPTYVKPSLA